MKSRILISLSLIAISLVCCSKVEEQIFTPYPYFSAIEKSRKAKPVDFTSIKQVYTEKLDGFVSDIEPAAASQINAAIQKGINKEKAHVQSQIVSKTLQKVFFKRIIFLLEKLPAAETDKIQHISDISALYQCLSPTVVRRGEWGGEGREMDDACLQGIQSLKEKSECQDAVNQIKNNLVKTYVLSVYYELAGIVENRGKNHEKCEEKQMEGILFYQTVMEYVEDKTLRDSIADGLSLNYQEMDIPVIREQLLKAFPQIKVNA